MPDSTSTVESDCTVSIGYDGKFSEPVSVEEFERRCDAIADAAQSKAVQPTLDDTVFTPLTISLVRLNFSGGWETELKDIRAKFDGQPLVPGTDIEFIVRGYICGAGIKFKQDDGAGTRTGALNINLTSLVAVLDSDVPVEPADGDDDGE